MATGSVSTPSKTFRIFVSSTFSDLKAERDALQRSVFPRLRELCASRGARFQAIDLRWGVSQEAGLDQRTMPICLGEIERCQRVTPRPNFIILLGDRYGWRPLPPEIPEREYVALEAKVVTADDKALLSTWYRLDENAVPPARCLKPRRVAAERDGRPGGAPGGGRPRSRRMGQGRGTTARRACRPQPPASGSPTRRGRRYEASATEQEIVLGALQVPDAATHVFGFFRTLQTTDRIDLAAPETTDPAARDFLDGTVSDGRFAFDTESHDRLVELKEHRLRPLLGGHVHDYRAAWTPLGIGTDHIGSLPDGLDDCLALLDDPATDGTLCHDVWRSLGTLIRDELEAAGRVDQLRAEVQAHEAFGRERSSQFVGREEALAAVARHLAGGRGHRWPSSASRDPASRR